MIYVYLVIWGFMLACGASAIWALLWAIRHNQLRDFAQSAASIFDPGEPIGVSNDSFPKGERS